jgi:peptide deformylase
MKEIITDYEKLSDWCSEIEPGKGGKNTQEIVRELKKVVREKNLKGLSAPQIGYDKRIFVINFNGDIRSFINPIIKSAKGLELSRETCSSIPNKTFIRIRNSSIEVAYMTPLGKIESRKMFGLAAIVFQHHIDHLNGLLLSDVGLEIDEAFDNATDSEREEVINAYLDSLDLHRKELAEEIASNEDLSKMNNAINFLEKVQNGEIEIDRTRTVNIKEDSE